LREFESKLAAFADVKVVTFDSPELAGDYRKTFDLDWPLLLDPQFKLYHAYTMEKGNLWSLASPLRIMRYLGDIFSGGFPGKKGKDIRQLGGDIVIDPQGIIRLFHPSQHPHDRPSANEIVELVTTMPLSSQNKKCD
jgi:peroxiredoxin